MGDRAREIVLPRSGVVLTLDPEGTGAYLLQIGGDWPIQFRPSRGDLGAKAWVYSDNWYEPAANGDAGTLSWLDARVLALRSALGFDAAIRAEREKALKEALCGVLALVAEAPLPSAQRSDLRRAALVIEALLAPPPAGKPSPPAPPAAATLVHICAHCAMPVQEPDCCQSAKDMRASLDDECRKFQQETRRTSELTTLLRHARAWIAAANPETGMLAKIDTLLSKPLNVPCAACEAWIADDAAPDENPCPEHGGAEARALDALIAQAMRTEPAPPAAACETCSTKLVCVNNDRHGEGKCDMRCPSCAKGAAS